jgi:hypothetical protein
VRAAALRRGAMVEIQGFGFFWFERAVLEEAGGPSLLNEFGETCL